MHFIKNKIFYIILAFAVLISSQSAATVVYAGSKTLAGSDKFSVYVDAGHGCKYTSAKTRGKYGFTNPGTDGEEDYVADFTAKLIHQLNDSEKLKGMDITQLEINEVKGSREEFGNSGREKLFLNSDCDAMIQIHYDKTANKGTSGAHIIYSGNSKDSLYLAYSIAKSMKIAGCRMNDYYDNNLCERHELSIFAKDSDKPVIIIELGMGVPGETDAEYLRDERNIKMMMDAIQKGIECYASISQR